MAEQNEDVAIEGMEINIDVNVPNNLNPPNPAPNNEGQNIQQARAQGANANNQFGNVRDRLFHAMVIRIALQYNEHMSITARRVIEFSVLNIALLLLTSLLFVHLTFARSTPTCLTEVPVAAFKDGVIRVEIVRNLKLLNFRDEFVKQYISEKSKRSCFFSLRDVFLYGPRVIPAEIRARGAHGKSLFPIHAKHPKKSSLPTQTGVLSFFLRSPSFLSQTDDEAAEAEEVDVSVASDPIEVEANLAFREHVQQKFLETEDSFEFVYRVEYAVLYGVLRLPPKFREEHGIKTYLLRIDANDKCFGDALTRRLMRSFIGYEDAIVNSLRALALNASVNPGSTSMGYLHDLQTHEHYHFVSNMMGKVSYLTAAVLMLTFTFAISMLLRFSHHQIFVFIVDLLHMFELQEPLFFPVAPIFTVILALVGMEAIMSEVFNDTTTAFYVILIVWLADQYDAICCHCPISKRYWLRFFYMYQFFFYAYQYRFGGQYGGLALITSATFILHSMIYFFHHYEMPLILYQDRVQHVLSEIHAPANMGTVEVQTVTVALRSTVDTAAPVVVEMQRENSLPVDEPAGDAEITVHPLSPSSVFDARGPASPPTPPPLLEDVVAEPEDPVERAVNELVTQAFQELLHPES
ncbi:unnamed protein product [Caenorhabditis auriculariae]|uniref:Membralin n=1 Tax=Caenorhabditis auriculariae TaxID=2777116 RepID=A0A8S1HT07_9PELO|nr:unnamed protein product [Caenorhabditis auriculariae]